MIVHQIWLPPPSNPNEPAPHPSMRFTMSTAGSGYKLWNREDAEKLVASVGGEIEGLYNSLPHHICKCDLLRYILMFYIGGAYFDCDFVALKSLKNSFNNISHVYVCEEWPNSAKTGTVHNGAIVSPPRHPFWMEVFKEILKRNNDLKQEDFHDQVKSVFSLTGTKLLYDVARDNMHHVKILPFYSFCPIRAGPSLTPIWHQVGTIPHPWYFEDATKSHDELKRLYPLSFVVPVEAEKSWQKDFMSN